MKPEQYQQVKSVFNAALELGPGERSAFLDTACESDASLRSAVEKLLAAHSQADSFIETPALDSTSELAVAHQAMLIEGQRIGPYRIVREIGQGGMGAVYLAERADDQYHKQTAIKLVRRGLDTADILRRFRSERQILANLDHPNIARLIDGGTTSDGLPYIVMEYVEGLPLVEYCNNRELSTVERLKLFRTVCAAVHYAHQNLVIHRDLKPGNILVSSGSNAKLLDFGIAKVFQPDSSAHEATRTELRAMTPEYASPEQVRGESVTTASDTYSLGVILYQLLTGSRPHQIKTTDPIEIVRAICEQQPERPSAAVRARNEESEFGTNDNKHATRNQKLETAKLRRQLRGDLDNIVLMAMRKEPERRYSSVQQFSDDIRRYLEGLPVLARKDTFSYRATRFAARNKGGAAAAVLIALSLVAGTIATAWQAKRSSEHARLAEEQSRIATQQRDKARLEQTKAERINAFLQQMLSYANPSWYSPGRGKKSDFTVLEALDEASRRIENELNDEPEIKAEIHTTIGDTYGAIQRNDLAEPHFEAALRIRRERFGDGHVKVAESLYYLGGIKFLKGDWVTSERLFQEALLIQRQMPNEGNHLPYMLLDMGNLLVSKADPPAAEALFREALDIFRNKHGEDHVTVAIAHEYLGLACTARGDLPAAETAFREALRIFEKTPGSNTAMTKLRLGGVYQARGEYKEAEAFIRQSLSAFLQAYGDKNARQNDARGALAHLLYLKGDYRAAKREAEKALQIDRLSLAGGNHKSAGLGTVMGMILCKMGQFASAESYLQRALVLQNRVQGENARAIVGMAGIKGALGECLMEQKRYREAEPLLREGYDSLKASQGTQSPGLKEATIRMATLYDRWKKPELAVEYRTQLSR